MIEPPLDLNQSKDIQDEQKRDAALYYVEGGEDGFDPKRNQEVIERTIQKYEKMRREKKKKYEENIRERSDAVATYIRSRVAEGSTPVEKYFGKKWMAYLRGQKILNIVKTKVKGKDKLIYLPQD